MLVAAGVTLRHSFNRHLLRSAEMSASGDSVEQVHKPNSRLEILNSNLLANATRNWISERANS